MNPECQNCSLRDRLDRLEQKYSDSRKGIYERLDKLENNYGRNDERWNNIKQDIEDLKAQQKEILAKIEALTQQPANRWNTAVSSLISGLIGAVCGAFGTRFLGGGL